MAKLSRDRQRIERHLARQETVLVQSRVQFVGSAWSTGVFAPQNRPERARRERPWRTPGRKGDPGTLGQRLPRAPGALWVALTPYRLLVGPVLGPPAALLWDVERRQLGGVEPRPRLQMMARFWLHFADDSAVALLTARQRTVDALAEELGHVVPGPGRVGGGASPT